MDISGTFAGLLDIDGDLALQSNDGVAYEVAVYAEDGSPNPIASGPAFVDCSVTVSISDAVRISGNFKAAGAWDIP
jgi:hypothetical protein